MPSNSIGPNGALPLDPSLNREITSETGKNKQVQDSAHTAAKKSEIAPGYEPAGEKLQISQKAKDLLAMTDLMNATRKTLDDQPDVRAERVQEVRERLKAGVYDTKGVKDELAHRLTSILGDLDLNDKPEDL